MTDESDAEKTDTAASEDDSKGEGEAAEPEATEAEAPEPEPDSSDDLGEAEEPEPAVAAAASDDTEPAVPPEPEPPSAETPVLDAPLTGAGRRFGAFVLDVLLSIVLLGIGWLIWSLVIWSKGQSPAKALLGMRVVKVDTGRAATWGTMFVREVGGKWLLGSLTASITTLVSGFMILGASRQGIWDKIAGTVVVDDPEGRLTA